MWLLAGGMLGLALWNSQLAYIYNSMMITTRDDALTIDQVTEAQVGGIPASASRALVDAFGSLGDPLRQPERCLAR